MTFCGRCPSAPDCYSPAHGGTAGRSRCRRARRWWARRPAAEPDVRQRRPARRHLRHQPADTRPHRRRRDAVHGDRRRRAAAADARRRPARARRRRRDDRPDGPARGGHRHAGRRVPRPVDDDLRAGGRPDRAAPARRRARGPAQHGLPGHDRLRRPAPRRTRLPRRRGLLPGADRRGPRPRGAAHAAPDRRRRHRRRGRASRGACSRGSWPRPSGRPHARPSSPSCSRTRGGT